MYTALGNVFADIVIAQSESENKDVKIARLEARVKELEAKLISLSKYQLLPLNGTHLRPTL
jgi:hypothetical protein